jgi:hypothetical protein
MQQRKESLHSRTDRVGIEQLSCRNEHPMAREFSLELGLTHRELHITGFSQTISVLKRVSAFLWCTLSWGDLQTSESGKHKGLDLVPEI